MATRRDRITLEAHTREHVLMRELSRVLVVVWPPLAWGGLLGAAFALRADWPGGGGALAIAAATPVLAGLVAHLCHHRKTLVARYLGAASMAAAGGWLAWAVGGGVGWPRGGPFRAWLFAGGALTLAWVVWLHVREGGDEAGMGQWFERASEPTSVHGLRGWVTQRLPHKISGVVRHRPGVVTADVIKAAPEMESARGLPPGSLNFRQHDDNAALSHFTLTQPSKLRTPALWPGPSRAGASIAEPIRYGMRADGGPAEADAVNQHLLIMGKSGSAKTTGPGFAEIAEQVSRRDAAVAAIDIAKGNQFLGPWRPALHLLAQEPSQARTLLWRVTRCQRPRTDFLAAQSLGEWQPGCGLIHLTVFVSEASWVFKQALSDKDIDTWVIPGLLAARSAGVRFVFEIQRADFTQLPIEIRAQLAHLCLGVEEDRDAGFGLSEYQKEHGCDPARWASRRPGMFYLDANGVAEEYRAMENRSYWWGPNLDMAAKYAAAHPASARPLDALTATYLDGPLAVPAQPAKGAAANPQAKEAPMRPDQQGGVARPGHMPFDDPPGDEDQADEAEPTGYDDEALWRRDPDEDGEVPAPTGHFAFGSPAGERAGQAAGPEPLPMDADQARERLLAELRRLRDEEELTEVSMGDLEPFVRSLGRSRTWPYDHLTRLVAEGVVTQLERPRRYRLAEEDAA